MSAREKPPIPDDGPCTRPSAANTPSSSIGQASSWPRWPTRKELRMATDDSTVTLPVFALCKAQGRKIAVLTAYDYTMARLLDEAGVDCLLVGDSLGTVVQGHATTLAVTLDQMLYHVEMVARAARRALVVADMPFLSYQPSLEHAILSAGRFLKET